MLELKPERSLELMSTVMDDGTVIVSPTSGQLCVVNEVGSAVWELVDGHHTVGAIVQQIFRQFDVSYSQAQQDVIRFLEALEERDIINWKPDQEAKTDVV